MKTVVVLIVCLALAAAFVPDDRDEKRSASSASVSTARPFFSNSWANYPVSGLNSVQALQNYAKSGNLGSFVSKPSFLRRGQDQANPAFMTRLLGSPQCAARGKSGSALDIYCAITNPCSCTTGNSRLASKLTQTSFNLGGGRSLTLKGLRPWVDLLVNVFTKIKTDLPDFAPNLRTAGGFCCRKIKRKSGGVGSGYSNHSWGTAIDLYVGRDAERNIQKAMAIVARYFAAEGAYWIWSDDGMHFEASQSLLNRWRSEGKI